MSASGERAFRISPGSTNAHGSFGKATSAAARATPISETIEAVKPIARIVVRSLRCELMESSTVRHYLRWPISSGPATSGSREPWIERSIRDRLGSEAENVAVRILDVHLERPGVVARRLPDPGAARSVFGEERLDVLDPDPRPGAGAALVAAAQVDPCRVAIHGGELVVAPLGVAKTEHVDVVAHARAHVRDAQDGRRAFELRLGIGHADLILGAARHCTRAR